LVDPITIVGGAILTALVAVRAGLIVAAFAFVQIAIITGNVSKEMEEPLKTLFVWMTFAFGGAAVVAMLLFFFDHLRGSRKSKPSAARSV
jgi:hypothetical protein